MLVDKVSLIYLVENCVDVDKIAECVNLDGRGSTYNDKTSYSSCSYTVTKHACCIRIKQFSCVSPKYTHNGYLLE